MKSGALLIGGILITGSFLIPPRLAYGEESLPIRKKSSRVDFNSLIEENSKDSAELSKNIYNSVQQEKETNSKEETKSRKQNSDRNVQLTPKKREVSQYKKRTEHREYLEIELGMGDSTPYSEYNTENNREPSNVAHNEKP